MTADPTALRWVTSSYSAANNECVEVAASDERVYVRDSKDTTRPALSLSPAAFAAFIDHTAAGHQHR
ncbi:DUF397 domain-containing protein [Streptomyces albus]|uniref:DUF397 domain-containing protein n=1 Tax=Streptomyces albus TaxID=1888 RepID=UPI0024E15F45|nr:DUF397 domain-containing protein [Streptomyces albus]GHJ24432.1 hypothetical protein TPA0909_60460 [Streptomyces albus]